MDRPRQFISSVRVESNGVHDYVSVFIRGQNVGTLCCGKGDGQPLADLLERDLPKTEATGSNAEPPKRDPAFDALVGYIRRRHAYHTEALNAALKVPDGVAKYHPMGSVDALEEAIAFAEQLSRTSTEDGARQELERRGLDLHAMNRGRGERGMPKLTASEMLARLDAAAAPLCRGVCDELGVGPEHLADPRLGRAP